MVIPVGTKVTGVQGRLLHWARTQQELTMRWVDDSGGPSLGYQSEVERGKKREVRSELLSRWTQLLGVTVPFALGQIPRYHENPRACQGLAADIARLIADSPDRTRWQAFSPIERAREVLRLIARESTHLPKVVLAYTLGVEVRTLEAMMDGAHPIQREHLRALIGLTTLPERFFTTGTLEDPLMDRYRSALLAADADRVTPEELEELVALRRFLPALRWAERAGITPDRLAQLLAAQHVSAL